MDTVEKTRLTKRRIEIIKKLNFAIKNKASTTLLNSLEELFLTIQLKLKQN